MMIKMSGLELQPIRSILTLSVPENLKNTISELRIIQQTLNISH